MMSARSGKKGSIPDIDVLKDRHVLAFDRIAYVAWHTALQDIDQHRNKLYEAVMQFLGPRKSSETVANAVVEKVFGVKTCDALLDIRSDRLTPLVDTAPNPALACIWETKESHKKGYSSLMQELPLDSAGMEDLLSLSYFT
jgi:hypothetical protein